jgi:Tol biopolymer transport system component
MAQRFDAGKLHLEGDAFPIADRLWSYGSSAFGVSDSGVLAYAEEEGVRSQLTWFDRLGRRLSAAGPEGPFIHMDLSRDGRRVLLERFEEGRGDLWALDLARNVPSRLTSGPSWAYSSTWSPDGSSVAYTLSGETSGGLYQQDASGAGQPKELISLKDQLANVSDWSADGQYIVYSISDPQNQFDMWVLPMSTGKAVEDRKPFPYLRSPFLEAQGHLSPDGRWMAYGSNEAGTVEVYVSSFPTPSKKVRISSGGGRQPRWRGDGKELFYLVPADRMLMSVPIQTAPALQPGTPAPLFRTDAVGYFDFGRYDYGVTANGDRFLVNTRVGGPGSTRITVTTNWQAALPR